jgi:glycosyltransferase involved in cell wall biosynthesis
MSVFYVYPADANGCGAYRLIWPAEALQAQGHDVRIVMPSARAGIGGEIDERTGKLVNVDVPQDADVVVMQRVSLSHLADAIPLMRARGIAVVVDMDDDLGRIDPNNAAFSALHPLRGRDPRHTWVHAGKACMQATLVTTSTPRLLDVYAPHGRRVLLRNRVPRRFLDVERIDSTAIGWPGSVHSHPLDLQQVGPAVARLAREGIEYWGVGPREGLREALGLDVDPEATGNVELDDWAKAIGSLGIGMAPLADTSFNQSKSWLKVLEMSAAGVPWVASPRDEYVEFSRQNQGVGLFAAQPRDWYRQLKRLALDSTLRADQSMAGRAAGMANILEDHAWRWVEAWTDALSRQRRVGQPLSRRNTVVAS